MTRIFQLFFMWKMNPMSGFDIGLVFTLPPRDSTLQYKRCVHLWYNFPCISTSAWRSSEVKKLRICHKLKCSIPNILPPSGRNLWYFELWYNRIAKKRLENLSFWQKLKSFSVQTLQNKNIFKSSTRFNTKEITLNCPRNKKFTSFFGNLMQL